MSQETHVHGSSTLVIDR